MSAVSSVLTSYGLQYGFYPVQSQGPCWLVPQEPPGFIETSLPKSPKDLTLYPAQHGGKKKKKTTRKTTADEDLLFNVFSPQIAQGQNDFFRNILYKY